MRSEVDAARHGPRFFAAPHRSEEKSEEQRPRKRKLEKGGRLPCFLRKQKQSRGQR
ncbi:hypothetical protein E2562_032001, partial [Oryza meyeriana var. granulata]